MNALNPWYSLRHGDASHGLAMIREALARDQSASRITQLGVAYLFIKDYDAAWEHFQRAMVNYRFSMAAFYGMAGVAKWCLNEPQTAVEWWQLGIAADYADGAGGVHLPLLLCVASILRPGMFDKEKAHELLRKRIDDPRVENWPGPLARFALGLIDGNTLDSLSRNSKTGELTLRRKWLIDFYRYSLEADRGYHKVSDFRRFLREMSDTSKPKWSDESAFVSLVWNEEFFIARNEASSR